jgi:hypothetical protein
MKFNARRKRSIGNWGVEKGAGWINGGTGGTERKCLQNDEVIEYALDRSDLFCPSRAPARVLGNAEPPKVFTGTRRTLGVVLWPPSSTRRRSRGRINEIYGIL